MNLKQQILQDLLNAGTKCWKLKYFKHSPYQKKRYKAEFVEQECWLYVSSGSMGQCITENEWKDEAYKEMIIDECKSIWK